ncbi:MAG: hypothetical protein ACR2NI_07925, partial [Pirellulales bacterium]
MPLISDATNILVGGTDINKVYAGSDLVWERSLPSTQQVVIDNYAYAVWPYQFTDCNSVTADWLFRRGWDLNGSGSAETWDEWYAPEVGNPYWFYSPQHKKMCMANALGTLNDTLVNLMWYQVYDRRSKKTILTIQCDRNSPVYPRPSDAYNCTGPLPIESQIQTQLPTDPILKRTFVTWENTYGVTDCTSSRWSGFYALTGISSSPDGSTEPQYWDTVRLDAANYKMVWPTYNAMMWSPDSANSSEDPSILRRLWVQVYY